MKHLLLFDDEVPALCALSAVAALFFTIASGAFWFIMGVTWDVAMSEPLSADKQNVADAVTDLAWKAFWFAIVVAIVSGGYFGWRLRRIKQAHRYSEDEIAL